MPPETQKVVEQLQAFRAQGMSYFEAVQKLQAAHVSQPVIDDASNKYDYQQGTLRSAATNASAPAQLTSGTTPDEYANTLLAVDKQVGQAAQRHKNIQRQPMLTPGGNSADWMPVYVKSWWYIVLLLGIPIAYVIIKSKLSAH